MDTPTKARAIEFIFDHIFIPQVASEVHGFLAKYRKHIEYKTEYKLIIGYDIALPDVPVLDLSKCSEEFIRNVVAIIAVSDLRKSEPPQITDGK